MLVLTRKQDESIMIGDEIEITVLEIHENHIRLGVSAPREIPVHRKEIYIAIQEENILAASPGKDVGPLEGLLRKGPDPKISS